MTKKPTFNPLATVNGPPKHPSGDHFGPRTLGFDGVILEEERPGAHRKAAMNERRLRDARERAESDWSHKNEGTAQTHERAARMTQGPLARLYMAGDLTADQLAWAVEIGETAELIERDVAVRVVSYEPRIDCQASGRDVLVEGIHRVRCEWAYSHWRAELPHPTRAVLDMLVGEPVAFSTIAQRYRIHKRKARRLLIAAIDRWPVWMEIAEEEIDAATVAAAHMGLT